MKVPVTFALVLGLSIVCARLDADMGSVWVEGVTADSITINWSDPTLGHRLATQAPQYKVSWEAVNPYPYPYPENPNPVEFDYFEAKPVTIPRLVQDTHYKITVQAFAQKLTSDGLWVNSTHRFLGVVRQKTQAEVENPNLRVSRTSRDSFTVVFTNPEHHQFDKIRVAYKERWSAVQLNATAMLPLGPVQEWGTSNAERGWQDRLSVSGSLEFTFPALSSSTRYEIVAFGFNIGEYPERSIASAMCRTGGLYRVLTNAACLELDHIGSLETYGNLVSRSANKSIIDMIRSSGCLGADDSPQLEDGDNLDHNLTALRYFIVKKPEVFECWQQRLSEEDGLTLDAFLATLPPEFKCRDGDLDTTPPVFQRGDSDRDGNVDITDAILILEVLFPGTGTMYCLDAADADDNGDVELTDAVYLLSFIFLGDKPPPSPHKECGIDKTDDKLDCWEYNGCPTRIPAS